MSNILLRLSAVLLLVALIVTAIGYALPRDFEIESTITIDAPPATVFPMINNLPGWQQWSTWNEEKIDSLKIEYGVKQSGTGAVQTWTDSRGSGKLWITDSQPPDFIEYSLIFGEFPEMSSRIELTPVDDGTLLRWSSRGQLPSGPFYGYSGLLFPRQMTHQYEMSLDRLKQLLE